MKGHGEKQSRTEDRAILALLAEPTLERAVKKCGIRKPEVCQFNKYRPVEARLHVDALSGFNLPQLPVPYLTQAKKQNKGSKEALAAWINAEDSRQHAFHKDLLTGSLP
jgi:hypothetical protein